MSNATHKIIASLFFLSAFLFLRVANAHTLSHFSDDDHNHCELCEIISVSQELTPCIDQVPFDLENKTIVIVSSLQFNSGYVIPLVSIVTPDVVHNKPPPFFLN